MGVGIKVGSVISEVGAPSFLHCFFSTISYHLEPGGWGSRFPLLMNDLYEGELTANKVLEALSDIATIRAELGSISPAGVVWDINDLNAKPPWGSDISPHITSLANYFVTSTGRDLFEMLVECLQFANEKGYSVSVT